MPLVGGLGLAAMHDEFVAFLATRRAAQVVPVTPGQPGRTYHAMLTALAGRPGSEPADDAR